MSEQEHFTCSGCGKVCPNCLENEKYFEQIGKLAVQQKEHLDKLRAAIKRKQDLKEVAALERQGK